MAQQNSLNFFLQDIWKASRIWIAILIGAGGIAGLITAFPSNELEVMKVIIGATILVVLGVSGRRVLRILEENRRSQGYHKDPDTLVTTSLTMYDVEFAVNDLVSQIKKAGSDPDLIIGIDRGGAILGGMLAKQFQKPFSSISVNYSLESLESASDTDNTANSIDDTLKKGSTNSFRKVLIADDASRSGTTAEIAKKTIYRDARLFRALP